MMIDHFIWGYQGHYRSLEEHRAERLFKSLDERFAPEIFIVGILEDERIQKVHPACVEPENDFWLKSEELNVVKGLAHKLLNENPEHKLFQSNPLAQQWQDQRLHRKILADAIIQILNSHSGKPDDIRFYCSHPVKVDNYLVSLILGLQKSVIKSYSEFKVTKINVHELRSINVSSSLIDSAVSIYLREVASELLKPDPGSSLTLGKSSDEIIRASGAEFIRSIGTKFEPDLVKGTNSGFLFDEISKVSSLKYEKSDSQGAIVLAKAGHASISPKIVFSEPVDWENSRRVRKLLELARNGFSLHADVECVYGLVSVNSCNKDAEDLFEVKFTGYHAWELLYNEQILMRVKSGLPSLPKPLFNEERVKDDLKRVFMEINSIQIDQIMLLIKAASLEKKGTLLLFSKNAENECKRLATQSTLINPCMVDSKILNHITPIDGAVLVDLNGVCFAIGVILDGVATKKGDPTRGARYNSAVRYVEMNNDNCMAVVISEDGGVDIIPDLMPRLKKSEIQCKIKELKEQLDRAPINDRVLRKIIDWLEAHRFYLLESHCFEINQQLVRYEDLRANDSSRQVQFSETRFKPVEEFNPNRDYIPE